MKKSTSFLISNLFIFCGVFPAWSQTSDPIQFNRDIRPILSDRCFACHGPDNTGRKAGLRLDRKEGLFGTTKGGNPVLVPSQPENSEFWQRILSNDPNEQMPPPESKLSITPREKDLLKRWIEQGAPWQGHWAFEPILTPPIPPIKTATIVPQPSKPGARSQQNPIDAFVLSKLSTLHLTPAPEADPLTLLRRVTFDLTGLPPTLEEQDQYLSDSSADRYEKTVDRLLNHSAYGERMANDWLDVARFADTYGYQADRFNHLWPWRDWVIRTFNNNLPYNDFIRWQIAGDLLPNATDEQYLATAFNRNHRQTNEGGSVNEEFRVEYNADRVHTTGMAFLGLTLECSRCHNHKFDPITQKDYYQLMAFFNSTDESGLYSHFTDAIPSPTLLLYPDGKKDEHRSLKQQIAQKDAERAAYLASAKDSFEKWTHNPGSWDTLAGLVGHFPLDEIKEGKVANLVNPDQPGTVQEGPETVPAVKDNGLLFSGENSVQINKVAFFNRSQPFSLSLWIQIPSVRDRMVVLHQSKAYSDAGSRGYELVLENGHATFALIHFWPGNAIKIETQSPLPLNEWGHLTVTYEGSSRAEGMRLYWNGAPTPTHITRNNLFKDILYGDNVPLTLSQRFRDVGFKNGRLDDLKIFSRQLTPPEVARVYSETLWAESLAQLPTLQDPAQKEDWFQFYLQNVDTKYQSMTQELQTLRDQERSFVEAIPEIMVMGDLKEKRQTYILRRGAYDAPTDPVEPGTPEAIFPFPPNLPKNRLGLAEWLVDRQNPLTARVTVNRYWQLFFGRGIVSTPEDFGSQGALPTHPELLDWLASWFMDNGWDLKALCRLITTSNTYRQSSNLTSEKAEIDPFNQWLSRGPQRRLSAEMLWDNAIAASGLLDFKIGGPSQETFRATGHKSAENSIDLKPLYRRGIYQYVKRTETSPYLTTFDATSRETCIARRQSTNTPLQALILLNESFFHQTAKNLAQKILNLHPENPHQWITLIYRQLTGKQPTHSELQILEQLLKEQKNYFEAHPDETIQYLDWKDDVTPRPIHSSLNPSDWAAASILANTLINYDASIQLR